MPPDAAATAAGLAVAAAAHRRLPLSLARLGSGVRVSGVRVRDEEAGVAKGRVGQ